MEDQDIQTFLHQLEDDPEDWYARAHLAGLLEGRGDRHGAAHVIMGAPSMPSDRQHILAAVRILTPVNPAASLPYLQLLSQAGAAAYGESIFPGAPAPAYASHEPPTASRAAVATASKTETLRPTRLDDDADGWKIGHPVSQPPVHLTPIEKPHFGTSRFLIVVAAHVVALVLAAWWVIAVISPPGKDKLTFDQTPPRTSAAKGTETAVKLAKRKSSSSAPATAKRVLSRSAAAIVLPPIENPSPLADMNFSNLGIGGGGLGMGYGGTGGNGMGGPGMGGGRGRFMGAFNLDSRCSKGDREKRIAESGGVPETEKHVKKSLDWLKKAQNADGSWGSSNRASMTALSLLSYLGHCETPETSREYGEAVLKGIMWLIELQMKKYGLSEKDPGSNGFPYEHGIGTYALAEAYSMTRYGTKKIPDLREAVIGAVEVIIKGQATDGGWNYGYAPTAPQGGAQASDMSVSGWQVQALNAARHTGMEFHGMDECYKKIADYLKADYDESRGGFAYVGGDATMSMSGVGGLALIVHGKDKSAEMRKTVEFMTDYFEEKKRYFRYDESEGNDPGLYGSYYINQVAFMRGGNFWRKWNKSLQDELLVAQNADGSYRNESHPSNAHSSRGAGADADIFRVCLCTLMLEVYYRYLPATEKHVGSKVEQ